MIQKTKLDCLCGEKLYENGTFLICLKYRKIFKKEAGNVL
ncbi:MAG: hypothetical protein BAJALOKI1v1_400001 [Promethearchaeota archaeon]|nr:MAG: hypothetical protein BAJALOKI1v1_400001 [Candidatus Lokiarchaeota archaeon]